MSTARRSQRYDDIEVHLDGDAQAWAWTPNIDDADQRIEMDLLPHLASYAAAGVGRTCDEATHDRGRLTVSFSVDLGSRGRATLGGEPISTDSIVRLVAAGWHATVADAAQAVLAQHAEHSPPPPPRTTAQPATAESAPAPKSAPSRGKTPTARAPQQKRKQ